MNSGDHNTVIRTTLRGQSHGVRLLLEPLLGDRIPFSPLFAARRAAEKELAEREELIRLRREVAEYEVEFRGLKNQDITIRKLESELI